MISTSSSVALRFVFSNIHHGKLISQLVFHMNTLKVKDPAFIGAQYLLIILQEWPIDRLEPHIQILQRGLRKGLTDASMESRVAASKWVTLFMTWVFPCKFNCQVKSCIYLQNHTNNKIVFIVIVWFFNYFNNKWSTVIPHYLWVYVTCRFCLWTWNLCRLR